MRGEDKRFSAAKTTPSEVFIPIAHEPSYRREKKRKRRQRTWMMNEDTENIHDEKEGTPYEKLCIFSSASVRPR